MTAGVRRGYARGNGTARKQGRNAAARWDERKEARHEPLANRAIPHTRHCAFWRDKTGSLTVEAMLILPVIFLLMALYIRWGIVLRNSIRDAAESEGDMRQDSFAGEFGFLYGGPPARRIRDADLLIDFGYTIKERLPEWFQSKNE